MAQATTSTGAFHISPKYNILTSNHLSQHRHKFSEVLAQIAMRGKEGDNSVYHACGLQNTMQQQIEYKRQLKTRYLHYPSSPIILVQFTTVAKKLGEHHSIFPTSLPQGVMASDYYCNNDDASVICLCKGFYAGCVQCDAVGAGFPQVFDAEIADKHTRNPPPHPQLESDENTNPIYDPIQIPMPFKEYPPGEYCTWKRMGMAIRERNFRGYGPPTMRERSNGRTIIPPVERNVIVPNIVSSTRETEENKSEENKLEENKSKEFPDVTFVSTPSKSNLTSVIPSNKLPDFTPISTATDYKIAEASSLDLTPIKTAEDYPDLKTAEEMRKSSKNKASGNSKMYSDVSKIGLIQNEQEFKAKQETLKYNKNYHHASTDNIVTTSNRFTVLPRDIND